MGATKKKRLLRQRAAAAAYALLGIVPSTQAAETADHPVPSGWTLDTSLLQYSESQRISVTEPQVRMQRDLPDNRSLNVLLTVDTISGATPLGLLPSTPKQTQTITSPSGRAINPGIGQIPTAHMTDHRYALESSWQQPLNSDYTGLFGASVSKESDFASFGANASLARDFNQKNTTLSVGFAPEFDISSPVGGLPVAYAMQQTPGAIQGSSATKHILGGLIGITQNISRQTLMQWNYTLTVENGYLNDPYKLFSQVDANGDPVSALFEKRPGSRTEHSLYWLTRHALLNKDVLSLGLRLYTDDWGIRSQTVDLTYRWQYEHHFLEPHFRYYQQTAADFYHLGLLSGQPLPNFASADYRLSSFDSYTIGIRWGWTLQNGSQLILRAEYYTQLGDSYPNSVVGNERLYNLFPSLNASIFQMEYTFDPYSFRSRTKKEGNQ